MLNETMNSSALGYKDPPPLSLSSCIAHKSQSWAARTLTHAFPRLTQPIKEIQAQHQMATMCKTPLVLTLAVSVLNDALSFVLFCFLDLMDLLLCFLLKAADYLVEAEWKPCYCGSAKEPLTGSGNILITEHGEAKILSLTRTKIQLDEISDTLYSRPSLLTELSDMTVGGLKKLKIVVCGTDVVHACDKNNKQSLRINSAVIAMLQHKIGGQKLRQVPRWSDCNCDFCSGWATSAQDDLYVRVQAPKDYKIGQEDVLFIHGFVSSSAFWAETLFPNFSEAARSTYRLFAVDLLGFGRSPKPIDSLYTLREHLERIEKSVLAKYKVKSFHIVAHSLGCILALALAVRHPGSVKSLTLIAPPYYPVPKGEQATQYVMRRVAPRRVWPPMAFGASLLAWYEHITRAISLVLCKHHTFWDSMTKLVTRNRIRTYLIEGFFCHTHYGSWHTLHNIIFGTGSKLEQYLDTVRDGLRCSITIFHGGDDEVIPVQCSYDVQRRVPRARVKVIDKKDHITIVVGRQKAFARELEEIWRRSK